MKKCLVCGKDFDGNARDVCSWQCDENRKKMLDKKMRDAIKNDKSHAKNLSENGGN